MFVSVMTKSPGLPAGSCMDATLSLVWYDRERHGVSFSCYFCNFTGPSCRHIKKGTDQTLLKKLSGNSDWNSCQDCNHEENKENYSNLLSHDSEDEQEIAAIWMCLKCGHRVSCDAFRFN